MRLLIQHAAEIHDAQPNGTTPLMNAAWFGCSESVEVLLRAGADATARDDRGRTASELAAERGHAHIERVLAD